MMGQNNHTVRTEGRDNMKNRSNSFDNTKKATQVNYPQVNMHALQENIVSKVRSEVNDVMTTVETRVQDAVLFAIENPLIPRVELAMGSANASSGRKLDCIV